MHIQSLRLPLKLWYSHTQGVGSLTQDATSKSSMHCNPACTYGFRVKGIFKDVLKAKGCELGFQWNLVLMGKCV